MSINKIVKEQLENLQEYIREVDQKPTSQVPTTATEIIFSDKKVVAQDEPKLLTVVFEQYIVHPYGTFDFHDKFNNGIAPPEATMQGVILKETEKMLYLNVHTSKGVAWTGWCPKKSCKIVKQS